MLIMAALFAGAFAFSLTVWMLGQTEVAGTSLARLSRWNQADRGRPSAVLSLRRHVAVQFGGINLVPAKLAANWTIDLERAGVTLNVKEYFALRLAVGAVFAVLTLLLVPFPPAALATAPVGFVLVSFWLKRRISTRTRKLEAQLVELLQMLASGLRAGFGLLQALESAASQMPVPLSLEVRRMLRDTSMGASVEQALSALNERVGSKDFDIVITAILIQRTVGGNLAEILDNVAHTMRERERIRGEIRTLTSQQRLTGYVVGGIPVGLGVAFALISPEFIGLLFSDSLGHILLGVAAGLEVMGFIVIKKIVDIEV